MKNKIIGLCLLGIMMLVITGCKSDSDIASHNVNEDARYFKVTRRIVFYNSITDTYLLEIEGNCTVDGEDSWGGNVGKALSVTCKVGEDQFKKHFLGLSDNVTFVAEQLEPRKVSKDHYKVNFKPKAILPDIDIK